LHLGLSVDFILPNAVWMHVPPGGPQPSIPEIDHAVEARRIWRSVEEWAAGI
jgi:hypothetical protein